MVIQINHLLIINYKEIYFKQLFIIYISTMKANFHTKDTDMLVCLTQYNPKLYQLDKSCRIMIRIY